MIHNFLRLAKALRESKDGFVLECGSLNWPEPPEGLCARERLLRLKLQRDELAVEIRELQERLSSSEPEITPEKIERFAQLLRDRLAQGSPEFRQAYVRILMQEVSVTKKEIKISGSKATLAKAASQGLEETQPRVLSFVREWRAKDNEDENFCFLIRRT